MRDQEELVNQLRALDLPLANEAADRIEALDSTVVRLNFYWRQWLEELENRLARDRARRKAEMRTALWQVFWREVLGGAVAGGVFGAIFLFGLWQTGDANGGLAVVLVSSVSVAVGFVFYAICREAAKAGYSAYQRWRATRTADKIAEENEK